MTALLSPEQAARELCISEKQLRALTCAGRIRYVNEAGSELDIGFDVDQRPPGNVAGALLRPYVAKAPKVAR